MQLTHVETNETVHVSTTTSDDMEIYTFMDTFGVSIEWRRLWLMYTELRASCTHKRLLESLNMTLFSNLHPKQRSMVNYMTVNGIVRNRTAPGVLGERRRLDQRNVLNASGPVAASLAMAALGFANTYKGLGLVIIKADLDVAKWKKRLNNAVQAPSFWSALLSPDGVDDIALSLPDSGGKVFDIVAEIPDKDFWQNLDKLSEAASGVDWSTTFSGVREETLQDAMGRVTGDVATNVGSMMDDVNVLARDMLQGRSSSTGAGVIELSTQTWDLGTAAFDAETGQ